MTISTFGEAYLPSIAQFVKSYHARGNGTMEAMANRIAKNSQYRDKEIIFCVVRCRLKRALRV